MREKVRDVSWLGDQRNVWQENSGVLTHEVHFLDRFLGPGVGDPLSRVEILAEIEREPDVVLFGCVLTFPSC